MTKSHSEYFFIPLIIIAHLAAVQQGNENWTLAYTMGISEHKSSKANTRNYMQNFFVTELFYFNTSIDGFLIYIYYSSD